MVLSQVPLTSPSLLVTVRCASSEQLSLMVRPCVRRYCSVLSATGLLSPSHPTTVESLSVPEMFGTLLSLILMV